MLLRLEILIAMVPQHHKEHLGGIAILEQSFGLVHSLTALLPKEKIERLVLASQLRKKEIAGWVGPTKKGMGAKNPLHKR